MNPISESGPWSLGTLIGLPIALIIILALLAFGMFCIRERESGMATWTFSCCFVMVVFTAWSMWPFSSEFHQWRTVQGPVEKVNKRLIAKDSKMSERYVLLIGGRAFGVDDTRASLVEVGDTVTLKCKREFEYQADSGWACRWGNNG